MFRIRGKDGEFQHRHDSINRNQTEILQLKNTISEINTSICETFASRQDGEDSNIP